ncbi:MAG: ferrous iron transport protein A [Ruminococcus sp.]|nr:ferrous iron transport protein A [Ruminococcus sp.]
MKLSDIKIGQKVKISGIDMSFDLAQRLVELGFSVNTEVKALIKGMGKSLTAYKVKNTVVALRNETADRIYVVLQ